MNDLQHNPTDPKLDALLDEALGGEQVPAGLSERIVAQTRDMLPARRTSVIARIGPAPVRAVAAAVILAATVGVVVVASGIVRDANQVTDARQQIVAMSTYEEPTVAIDTEIQMLSLEIDMALAGESLAGSDALYAEFNGLNDLDGLDDPLSGLNDSVIF